MTSYTEAAHQAIDRACDSLHALGSEDSRIKHPGRKTYQP